MRHFTSLVILGLLLGCAGAKIANVYQPLPKGIITKSTPIYVEAISVEHTIFDGDKSADAAKIAEEKRTIEQSFNAKIADKLREQGFNAQVATTKVKSGVVLSGYVKKFEHGSAAARMFVGMGAGASKMFSDFKIEERAKTTKVLSKFEVVATSGGRSGWTSAGSFMEAHLEDGAEQIAEFFKSNH